MSENVRVSVSACVSVCMCVHASMHVGVTVSVSAAHIASDISARVLGSASGVVFVAAACFKISAILGGSNVVCEGAAEG